MIPIRGVFMSGSRRSLPERRRSDTAWQSRLPRERAGTCVCHLMEVRATADLIGAAAIRISPVQNNGLTQMAPPESSPAPGRSLQIARRDAFSPFCSRQGRDLIGEQFLIWRRIGYFRDVEGIQRIGNPGLLVGARTCVLKRRAFVRSRSPRKAGSVAQPYPHPRDALVAALRDKIFRRDDERHRL